MLNRIITLLVGALHCLRGQDGASTNGFEASGNKMAVISDVYYDTGHGHCHYLLYGPGYNGPEGIQKTDDAGKFNREEEEKNEPKYSYAQNPSHNLCAAYYD